MSTTQANKNSGFGYTDQSIRNYQHMEGLLGKGRYMDANSVVINKDFSKTLEDSLSELEGLIAGGNLMESSLCANSTFVETIPRDHYSSFPNDYEKGIWQNNVTNTTITKYSSPQTNLSNNYTYSSNNKDLEADVSFISDSNSSYSFNTTFSEYTHTFNNLHTNPGYLQYGYNQNFDYNKNKNNIMNEYSVKNINQNLNIKKNLNITTDYPLTSISPNINNNKNYSNRNRFLQQYDINNNNLTNKPKLKSLAIVPKWVDIPQGSKFFVIKSTSLEHIKKSFYNGIWSSTFFGNKRLSEAYFNVKTQETNGKIFLLFSVNASGKFCGVAEMTSNLLSDLDTSIWNDTKKFDKAFKVRWIIIRNIYNKSLKHFLIPLNDMKPVTNSRDTQELPFPIGNSILKIFKTDNSNLECFLDEM